MRKHGKRKEGVNIMNIKFILKIILAFILFLAEVGVFIFGIIWGCSLLASELQSPGSVSLSVTILGIFLFRIITGCIGETTKAIWETTKEELEEANRKRWRD